MVEAFFFVVEFVLNFIKLVFLTLASAQLRYRMGQASPSFR